MSPRFNPPPNWPAPPDGWTPPPGWAPSTEWGPLPEGWTLWVDDDVAAEPPSSTTTTERPSKVPMFGARNRVKELDAEVLSLRAELAKLQADLRRLGAYELVELEEKRDALRRETTESEQAFKAEEAQREAAHSAQKTALEAELAGLRSQVVVTQDAAILQEVGIYDYRHPLTDAAEYKAKLTRVQDQIKAMARKDGGAISATTNWTVNNSAAQGRKMVADISKLMLRAYNAEADNMVRGLKPYKLESAIERLDKVRTTIERLGKSMDIQVAWPYHLLRVQELELTADYLAKVAAEKELEREEKQRLREERKAQQEIEREKERLVKERQHYLNALKALEDNGDVEGAGRLRDQLRDVDRAIADVDYRAANIRAGYVYVISNVGAFGERMIKVGMTRRLEPMERVKELSDASVPFNFDVHALFFADDAVGIESAMHARLADRRVNRVNLRREFFYATPAEARALLLELAGDLLQFEELPEALEFRQSKGAAAATT